MSKVQLSGDLAGSGTITLAAPNTNSNVTLNLPAVAGTMATAESTLTQFNVTGSAPVYACRAWVNFDGTKDTTGAASTANTNRLIRASGNVTSVLRNGTGDYTITFTTAMPDANYTHSLSFTDSGGFYALTAGTNFSKAAGSFRIGVLYKNNSGTVWSAYAADFPNVDVIIFR